MSWLLFCDCIVHLPRTEVLTEPFNSAVPLGEVKFKDLNEALAYVDSHPVRDTVVGTNDIALGSTSEMRLPDGKSYSLTRAAFIQLIHFVGLQWKDVKEFCE